MRFKKLASQFFTAGHGEELESYITFSFEEAYHGGGILVGTIFLDRFGNV